MNDDTFDTILGHLGLPTCRYRREDGSMYPSASDRTQLRNRKVAFEDFAEEQSVQS